MFFQSVHYRGPNWVGGAWYGIFLIREKPALCAGLIIYIVYIFHTQAPSNSSLESWALSWDTGEGDRKTAWNQIYWILETLLWIYVNIIYYWKHKTKSCNCSRFFLLELSAEDMDTNYKTTLSNHCRQYII